ncbi:zinc ribbon domain-containing protein [Catenovulum sp. 2E275]|uniref:zinc ribbon domain-containing protein n=1 Tax=Catenovulum sp. 2E275 TaxID=2980497 RepID=UPI0021D35189|nr:zinc ribbon domain-containing protein [Catenovulum sp. 2E275]MCU4676214.1 zinc ribbon domain-containing protein [Catenovulum sp. 2E275]
MPLYDYKCAKHGVFQEMVPVAQGNEPCACPQCGEASNKVILIAPHILDMAPEKRKAHETNERASHQPVFSTVESRDKKHGRNCGCEHKAAKSSRAVFLPDGSKIFPSARPWMISH